MCLSKTKNFKQIEASRKPPSGVQLPHEEFLLQLPGQTLGAVRRKARLRDPGSRASSPLELHNLLSWVHPGFSVFAGPPVDGAAVASLESQGRYITRPALGMGALEKVDDDNLALETPPDPRTGATRVVLDPMEWIHRPRFLSFSHRFLLAPLDRNAYITPEVARRMGPKSLPCFRVDLK